MKKEKFNEVIDTAKLYVLGLGEKDKDYNFTCIALNFAIRDVFNVEYSNENKIVEKYVETFENGDYVIFDEDCKKNSSVRDVSLELFRNLFLDKRRYREL